MIRYFSPKANSKGRRMCAKVTAKFLLFACSLIMFIALALILSLDDTIVCSDDSIATVTLTWKDIVFKANVPLTDSTTPIEGITESGTFTHDEFLAAIKAKGIAEQSETWKAVYFVWWNISITMDILYSVAITSCILLGFTTYVMYTHREDVFVVGPETALFLMVSLVLGATICDYWFNVWYEINTEAWSNNQDLSCPFDKPAIGLLIGIQVIIVFGIFLFIFKWRNEIYKLNREAYKADQAIEMERRRRASKERSIQDKTRNARSEILSPLSYSLQ